MSGRIERRVPGLIYADVAAAQTFLIEVFGLAAGPLHRGDDGTVTHAEVAAGDGVIWLHPESARFNLRSPRTVGADTAGLSIMVNDVNAHYAHVRDAGAVIVYGPADMPYGVREFGARDLEDRLWSFMSPMD
ncbi:putative glyoxalase superfamily protein PhnB [Stackebrandtia endophytica]|uniref:Putative glyoxalase superfamily protein PhnB n=2 Tax=Stackebrandtia endophytica TaxID=1496996 RepID=A0A543AXC6_9ACTN|nr:putative glyoxalase superfamily protein PhnB [Stackebrandtia endophytica]